MKQNLKTIASLVIAIIALFSLLIAASGSLFFIGWLLLKTVFNLPVLTFGQCLIVSIGFNCLVISSLMGFSFFSKRTTAKRNKEILKEKRIS